MDDRRTVGLAYRCRAVCCAEIARNRAVHASSQRDARARILAERDLALVAFLWDSEFGDQFDVCPTSHFEDL